MMGKKFSPTEQRLLDRLKAERGGIVAHAELVWAIMGRLAPGDKQALYELDLTAADLVAAEVIGGRLYVPTRRHMAYLRQYISRLRKKIEVDLALPDIIITHRGQGYSYEEPNLCKS